MVSVSMAGENRGRSGDDNTVSHFTDPPPSCTGAILSMCLHHVDSFDHLYVEDYILVFYILTGNSNS